MKQVVIKEILTSIIHLDDNVNLNEYIEELKSGKNPYYITSDYEWESDDSKIMTIEENLGEATIEVYLDDNLMYKNNE